MTWDDALILFGRSAALVLFVLLGAVIAWRMRQPAEPRVRYSRWALLALWGALSYVSLYAFGQRLWPGWFVSVNRDIEWGPLSIALFNLLAAGLSAAVWLPWNRSKP